MSNELNEFGPSRPKCICTNRGYESRIEQMLFESESDDDFDFSDSGSDYMAEASSQVENDSESSDVDVDVDDTGNIQNTPTQSWFEEETDMPDFNFMKQNELLVPIPGDGNPIDFYFLLFDDDFINLLVDETNSYAEKDFLRIGHHPSSRISTWKPTDKDEMLTFLALIIHTGTIKLNRLNDYWKKHHLFNITCFSNYTSRDRFLVIMRCFHFAPNIEDDQVQPLDRLYKVRPLINYFNNKMNTIYYPKKELSLDESMVLWRGRLVFRQYIQNKRHKYGIKLYMLTEPAGLVLKFAVYTGVFDDMGGQGHASKEVLHLMSEKLENGHSLYMDNFYNSFDLATSLIQKNTYCTGTLRLNRKNTPVEVKQAKLKKDETIARYSNGVVIGKWRDKREVAYISTEFKNNMVVSSNKLGHNKTKPEPIVNYNKFMSGIDHQDQMQSYYPSTRKTIRWYKKIGIHTVQMLLMNSFYLYNKYKIGSNMP